MEIGDLEGAAESIFFRAGVTNRAEIVSPIGLAQRILGPDAVRRVPRLQSVASLAKIGGRHVIAVRAGLEPQYEGHGVAHELAHLVEDLDGVTFTEPECDYIGAAIMMPREVFLECVECDSIAQLAFNFVATQTSVVLRTAEVLGTSAEVVTPQRTYRRGRLEGPGLRKIRLTDAKGRFAHLPPSR